ncbi:MAG: hypothetical protein HOC91_09730 [Nitrospinaceae bacterium]|jgi:hypothetical protein|nr:hypothetical protein [Nitrospinaceae bacterium]MBT3432616.1 hypothetical protein [Nitrospinaceae bacterium]MBT3819894.1 hypothetical protein [Nitrospinaceae bacterium]MBT4430780.1 hypothetical protein [Nitrospinaceae bacterium]MBT5366801.1 hypothetical protein [Nitrospinaceae bacterium]
MSELQAYDTPGTRRSFVAVPAHASAAATELFPVFEAPVAAKIEKVIFRPSAAVTGVDTNTTHLNVIDIGTAGTGTTELGSYDLTSGNDLTKGERKELYAPSTVLSVSQNNLIGLQFEEIGTSIAVPAGIAIVEWSAN